MLPTNCNLIFFSTVFNIDSSKIKQSNLWIQNQQQAYEYLSKLVMVPNFTKQEQKQVCEGKFEILRKGLFRSKTVVLKPVQNQYTYCIFDLNNDPSIAPLSVNIASNCTMELVANNNTPVCSQFNEKLLIKFDNFDHDETELLILVTFPKFSVVLKFNFAEQKVYHLRLDTKALTNEPYEAYNQYLIQESKKLILATSQDNKAQSMRL